MQHQYAYGHSNDETGWTQQPCSSSQIPQNWYQATTAQLQYSGSFELTGQSNFWQQNEVLNSNAGNITQWDQQNCTPSKDPDDQTPSWNGVQLIQLQNADECGLGSSQSYHQHNESSTPESKSRIHGVDLQGLLAPDGKLNLYLKAEWKKNQYLSPHQCRIIAKIVLKAVVDVHSSEVPWEYMEDIAVELVRLCPKLGDPDDPEGGCRIWFDFKPRNEGYCSGYLCNKLRTLRRSGPAHSQAGKDDDDWLSESEEKGTTGSRHFPTTNEQQMRRAVYKRRSIAIQQKLEQAMVAINLMFPGFFTVEGQLLQDFYLRYPRLEGRFKRNWPRVAASLCEFGSQTQILKQVGIDKPYVTWSEEEKNLAALVLLSYLLPTEIKPKKQKRPPRRKAKSENSSTERLGVVRYGSPDFLSRLPACGHPYIMIEGDKAVLQQTLICIRIEGFFISCGNVAELALETLFASHFVLKMKLSSSTRPFLLFLQCILFERIPSDDDDIPTSVRQLLSQIRGPQRGNISFQQYGHQL